MSFCVTGFSSRWGIVMNRIVPPGVVTVSVAISLGVKTAKPTAGFAVSFKSEKSPARRLGCGILVEDWLDGSTVQFCSNAMKNQVFFNLGTGPPLDAPVSRSE